MPCRKFLVATIDPYAKNASLGSSGSVRQLHCGESIPKFQISDFRKIQAKADEPQMHTDGPQIKATATTWEPQRCKAAKKQHRHHY
jgi:hypothetical protein